MEIYMSIEGTSYLTANITNNGPKVTIFSRETSDIMKNLYEI